MARRIFRRPPSVVFLIGVIALASLSGFRPALAEPIRLFVDASRAPLRVLHARMTIPARPGPMSLSYPEWIPGEHAPTGPVVDVAGLRLRAGSATLAWRRDDEDMYRVRFTVPAGATSIEAELDFLGYAAASGFSAAASLTDRLALISWNEVVLYPSGTRSDSVEVEASVQLPSGWESASALPVRARAGARVDFAPATLTTLVDSPLLAGQYLRTIELTPPGGAPAWLHMAADGPDALAMDGAQADTYRALMREAEAMFGAHHYRGYHFLVSLSDHVAHFGLEHHESSDDRVPERAWVDADLRAGESNLLAHELTHSWNGKYRRPAGLATGDYHTPMKDELLWVYEGLTQYLGFVLSARAGIRTREQALENLALQAANLDHLPGRAWRPLEDTAVQAQLLYEASDEGAAARRGVDFYNEGLLIWLEADVRIRALTGGRRSLDDFCRRFFGGTSGPPAVVPYTLDDVLNALNAVAPWDWRGFFERRVRAVSPRAPMDGIEQGGWRLDYADSLGPFSRALQKANKEVDEWYALGVRVNGEDGRIRDVLPGSPASRAGVAPGCTLIAVNGRAWSKEVLRDAVRATAKGTPVELLVRSGEFFSPHRLDWKGGARYPRLERDPAKPDLVGAILTPLAPAR